MFDIIFISYNEPNAEENWAKLKARFPFAKRVKSVKGIHQAHIAAAKKCFTKMFWVVDGDSEVLDTFNFEDPQGLWDECVYVYRALNPVNGLVYGYGGIKLLPTTMTISMDITNVDMTTSISKNFTAVPIVASSTNFNTDPFNTWKSAFRECVKLASKVIDDSSETIERLDVWCNVANGNYADCAIEGAIAGRHYGEAHRGDKEALSKINDFDWLKRKFDASV
jgi:hypothetical protein